jgi:glycosyltransferase involved in cell wall biosynthesis
MKRIGIVLAYPPGVITVSEGLPRLLIFLIEGLIERGYSVVIICPEWCRQDLGNLFKDTEFIFTIKDQIEIISTGKIPPVVILHSRYLAWIHRTRHPSLFDGFICFSQDQVTEFVSRIAGTSSWIVFFMAITVGLVLSPIIFLGGLIIALSGKVYSLCTKTFMKIQARVVTLMSQHLIAFKDDLFARRIFFNVIYKREVEQLARLAQEQKTIHSWLLPTPFWPELVRQLPNPVVVCPDVVIIDFPVGFEREDFGHQIVNRRTQIEESLVAACHLITYSTYVKSTQITKNFAIEDTKISVIPHGHINLENSLNILKPFRTMSKIEQRDLCLQIITDYFQRGISDAYLRNFDFSGVRFLFYPSHIRPSKNIPALIKAIHSLIHFKHEPIKLILTGNPAGDHPIKNLITQLGLERDIIFLPNMPTRVLAAFYHLSALTVNPTLFEGGFPFTFSEAYSVGSPSLMSRIPVVEEFVTDPDLQKKMLFDPYNTEDMIDRISWGLHHRKELLGHQQPLYNQLKERSWAQVASEYADILEQVKNSDRSNDEI